MGFLDRFFGAPALRGWAYATLAVQSGIIITGTTVRLTGSGLGCPTWPKCTEDSYVPTGELTTHAAIEFGNRLLTFVLIAVAIGTFVAALRATRNSRGINRTILTLATAIGLGVPLQAVIGGVTVRTGLNPFVVAPHLLISVAMVALSTWLVRLAAGHRPQRVRRATQWLVRATFVAMLNVIWIGTIVTGSGPHAGDAGARRTGFDIETVAQLHSGAAWVLLALTIGCVVFLRGRASIALLIAVLAQGVIGYVQYLTGLPVAVVAMHMIGIPVCTIAGTWLLLDSTSARSGEPAGSAGAGDCDPERVAS